MEGLILNKSELKFKELKDDFINYIDVDSKTIRVYEDGIKSFIDYMQRYDIQNPTREDVKNYRNEMMQEKSSNTINSYMSSLRVFFNYLDHRNIYENITKDVKNVKTSKRLIKQTLSLQDCQNIYNSLTDKRERLIFSLAITTGLRAEEIATSKIENIKMYNGEYVLFVKGKKRDDASEYVKISNQVMQDIKDYIGDRVVGSIFVSTSNHNNGGGVTNATIRRIVKGILKRYGYEDATFSTHSLRRSCATLMYLNGATIYDIQQVLRHKSISTSARYISQITRDTNKSEQMISNLIMGDNNGRDMETN